MTGSRPEKRTKEEGEDRDRRSGKRIARGDSGAVETSPTGASQYATDNRTTSMVGPRHSINQEGSNFGGEYTLAPGASLQQGNITNIHETADKCLRDLRVTDPRHDKRRIQDTKGGLLKDSYVWVLDNPDFRLWCDDQHQRLLWIKGDPGKGKTMLLCGIIDELEATRAQGELASYFFCQATDERLNNATAVLRGLLYMLLEQEPSLVSHIKKKYDRDGKALFYDANAWHAMSEIFTNMLHDPKLQGVCLLVDALDECSTGLNQLLDLVTTTSQSTSAKWLVSSRNWWQIEERLRTVAQRLSLEVNATSVSTAVDSYITFKVAHLSQLKGYQDKTASKVRQYLSSNADGTFLWVALVCQELKKTPRWMALQIVESFPAGLDAFYERMMQQICEEKYTTELCSQVLALLATTYRPLSLAECTTFIEECRDLAEDRESLQDIIGLCGSFLTLREDTVYFVHQSAKDFLLNKQYNSIHQILPLGIKHQHHVILSKSLDALSSTLRRNIYELRSPGVCIENVSPPNPDPLAPLKYSCTHWVDHLEHSNPTESPACNDVQDNARVHRFLKRHFLHWVEAQSLLQGMAQAVAAIQKLLTLVAHAEGAPQLKELAQDTLRFVLSYKQCVESFPLQIYVAALLFSPTLSVVRQVFRAEAPAWITVVTEIEANWNACLQTLEGHGGLLYSVAFAPGGRLLASASSDNTVKLWDTAMGQCERTLEGHGGPVYSVAFAPGGRLLASASYDNTVKLWDTATGQCERTLKGHSSWVCSVAFAPDGRLLASASLDNTVKLWDTATGQCERTLEGHSDWVRSVAFAPDGRQLASGSGDKTVKLWDMATGQCQQTLEGHSDWVRSVAFSPDGRQLASGSDDKTIKLWGTATGQCQQTLEGHSDSVLSVAFSPDGRQLASGSYDNTVKLWDTAMGQCERTLKGHGGPVSSVAFAPDGRLLASASYNSTVKLWDTAMGQCERTLEGHGGLVESVAFAPDGRLLASASHDNTVKLWDTATGQCERTLEGHSSWVYSVAFAPDGRLLASASRDNTVKLWDTATGQCERTLEGHGRPAYSVAFAPDGRLLASASHDHTVKLWDTATGQCERTLEGHISLENVFEATIQKSSQEPNRQHHVLSQHGAWIKSGSQNILWLPPEYRAGCCAVDGSTIALGCGLGRVLIVQFGLEGS